MSLNRAQLEDQIRQALANVSEENMQRIAEDYARIQFPARFPRFDFRAFSGEGRSRKGWPDAWILTDGEMDGVEATADKSKPAVKKHFKKDLESATKHHPPLRGLILVSGTPSVQFNEPEITALRQRFITEALIEDRYLEIVFGNGLVKALAEPEFARTRLELLGIPYAPDHFKLMNAKRGPDQKRLTRQNDFIPSDDDYAKGHVYRHDISDAVLEQLNQKRCALVRGVGACGKSVLAWLLGLEVAEQRRPSYIIDLADHINAQIGNELAAGLRTFGHPQTLFIIDNCHLNEELAKEAWLAWEQIPLSQRPQLLLLGRELQSYRGSVIDGLNIEPIVMRAKQAAVRGVYLRLAWRQSPYSTPPEPPLNVLENWVRIFGGDPKTKETTTDLIAFSAAVRARMTDLLESSWTLTEADAIYEIRSVYLDELTGDEYSNLMRLCAMEELELSLPEQALAKPSAGFKRCTDQLGLVFRKTTVKSASNVRYRLAHAALGELIIRSAYEAVDLNDQRQAIASANANLGITVVGRLVALNRNDEASALLNQLLQQPDYLLKIGQFHQIYYALLLVETLKVTFPNGLIDQLSTLRGINILTAQALKTPLEHLAIFLNYISKTNKLEPVFQALVHSLEKSGNSDVLVAQALEKSLSQLASFLGYAAKEKKLEAVFQSLARSLEKSNGSNALVAQALKSPLIDLANFLSYLGTSNGLKQVFTSLIKELSAPNHQRQLTKAMTAAEVRSIVNAFNEDSNNFWRGVFTEIDLDNWESVRRADKLQSVDAFVSFQAIAVKYSRPELATVIAESFVLRPVQESWHRPVITLRHLSHVLRFAKSLKPFELENFLEKIALPNWVEPFTDSAVADSLAGNFFAIGTSLAPQHHHWFNAQGLRLRVIRELNQAHNYTDEFRAQTLGLLGASIAISCHYSELKVQWPSAQTLNRILRLRVPMLGQTTVSNQQVQLWLGLREMARQRGDTVTVSGALADPILVLWETTVDIEPATDEQSHTRKFSNEMLAWMRKCKALGWKLVPD